MGYRLDNGPISLDLGNLVTGDPGLLTINMTSGGSPYTPSTAVLHVYTHTSTDPVVTVTGTITAGRISFNLATVLALAPMVPARRYRIVIDGATAAKGTADLNPINDGRGRAGRTIAGDPTFDIRVGSSEVTFEVVATGPTGPGVAVGGSTGQALRKRTATNFDTEWFDPATQLELDAETAARIAGDAALDARLDVIEALGSLATDAEVAAAIAALSTVYQPLDSDLAAIAALTTTPYGRAFLALTDATAGRSALGLGTAATTAATAYDPAGSAAAALAAAIAASQPVDSDLTAIAALMTTPFGRGLLTLTNAAAARTTLAAESVAIASTVTATAYTLTGADVNETIVCVNACTVTVPTNASAAIPVGTRVDIVRQTAVVQIVAAAGVTLRVPAGMTARARMVGSQLEVTKVAADEWVLSGDLAPLTAAESLLRSATLWLDADLHDGSQTWANLGTGGPALNAQLGSGAGADANDPLWLTPARTGYVYMPGVVGNFATVPDSAALDITGDLEVVQRMALPDWSPSVQGSPFGKHQSASQRSYYVDVNTSGLLVLTLSPDGTATSFVASSAPLPFADGATGWIKVTWRQSDGRVQFFTATDNGTNNEPTTWTQLGTNLTIAIASIFASTSPFEIGSRAAGNTVLAGNYYRTIVRNGIDGPTVLDVDFSGITAADQATYTATTGQTVTFNRSATGRKLEIVPAAARARFMFGTDDFAEIPDHPLLDFGPTDSFTVCALVREWGDLAGATILAKKIGAGTTGAGYALRNSTGTPSTVVLEIADGVVNVNATLAAGTPSGSAVLVSGVRNVAADSLAVYSNSSAGTPATDSTTATIANAEAFRIGRMSGVGTGYLDAVVYAIAVFRGALTDAQLETIAAGYAETNPLATIPALAAADRVPYFTGPNTAAVAPFTATGRSIVGAASVAAANAVLGVTRTLIGYTPAAPALISGSVFTVAQQGGASSFVQNGTLSTVTGGGADGGDAARVTATGANLTWISQNRTASPSTAYTASVRVSGTPGLSVVPLLQFRDSGGVLLTSYTGSARTLPASGAIALATTATSDPTAALLTVRVLAAASASGNVFDVSVICARTSATIPGSSGVASTVATAPLATIGSACLRVDSFGRLVITSAAQFDGVKCDLTPWPTSAQSVTLTTSARRRTGSGSMGLRHAHFVNGDHLEPAAVGLGTGRTPIGTGCSGITPSSPYYGWQLYEYSTTNGAEIWLEPVAMEIIS